MQYQSRTYNVTPGGKSAGPTPVRPSGFRAPLIRVRDASKFVIDQIHEANLGIDDVDGVDDGPSGAASPQPGDDDCDTEDES